MSFWSVLLTVAVAVAGSGAAGCSRPSVVIEVRADGLTAPGDLDAFCLAVADREPRGGEFARRYILGEGGLTGLPQTLTVDPGDASDAIAWARGYWRGIEVARAAAEFSFGDPDVPLTLAGCTAGPGGPPSRIADAELPPASLAVLSPGRTGTELVAVADGTAALRRPRSGAIEALDRGAPEIAGAPRDLVPFDADGDCDDDLLVVADLTTLWRREPDGSFVEVDGALAGEAITGARAAAAADVDADGDIDLALGGAEDLTIWLNDGAARFARHPTPADGDGAIDVTRLAFGDFDDDGAIDLVAARGATEPAALRVLFNTGDGAFVTAPAALPDLPRAVRALAIRDMDGDRAADLVAAGDAMPITLYISRGDGRLEDQSFVRLPTTEPVDAASLAAADWDGDCLADLVVGLAGGETLSWRGDAAGKMVDDGAPEAIGAQVVLGDADDDGDIDLLAISGDRLTWAAR